VTYIINLFILDIDYRSFTTYNWNNDVEKNRSGGCNTKRNAYTLLMEKPEGMRSIGKLMPRCFGWITLRWT
jgi:hypothetical protein